MKKYNVDESSKRWAKKVYASKVEKYGEERGKAEIYKVIDTCLNYVADENLTEDKNGRKLTKANRDFYFNAVTSLMTEVAEQENIKYDKKYR